MSATTEEATQEAFKTFQNLDQNFNKLYDACPTEEDKNKLRATYNAARDAYWKLEKENLKDDNDFVKGLLSDLKDTNKQINSKLATLKNVVEVINLFGEAVKLAASIAALAAA